MKLPDCPEGLWGFPPWKSSQSIWIQPRPPVVSGSAGAGELTSRCPFQPQPFCNYSKSPRTQKQNLYTRPFPLRKGVPTTFFFVLLSFLGQEGSKKMSGSLCSSPCLICPIYSNFTIIPQASLQVFPTSCCLKSQKYISDSHSKKRIKARYFILFLALRNFLHPIHKQSA